MSGFCPPSREQIVTRKRFLQASDGINLCLPSDSGAQSISAGLLGGCVTALSAASVLGLQVWKGLCFLWGEIQTLQADIALRPIMRTPGAVNITAEVGAGVGAVASIVGNDTAGQITLVVGAGAASGALFSLSFDTPFTTAGILHMEGVNANAIGNSLPGTTTTVSGVSAASSGYAPITMIWNYVVLGGT